MADDYESDAGIEEDRKHALERIGDFTHEDFLPGTYGCHEALHTAYIMASMVEAHLLNHPAILLNPAWYRRASRAVHELAQLYQDIGAVDPSPSPPPKPQS